MVSESVKRIKINQNTEANCYIKYALPMLPVPRNIRICFSKTGSLQYISHLDLQRLFARALIRAGLPLWYTQGFNPHPKMVFALPLPVGVQSVCEFLDVKFDRDMSCPDAQALLDEELTDEMRILDVYEPTTKFSDIAYAKYEIRLSTVGADAALAEKTERFFTTSPILMTKRTKSGEKSLDITALISAFSAKFDENTREIHIETTLSAGSESLNPELLIAALRKYEILPPASLLEETYSILRKQVLCADGSVFR